MKVYTKISLAFLIVFCFSCKSQDSAIDDFKHLGLSDLRFEGGMEINFRDSIGKINWKSIESNKKSILSDSILNRYFKNVYELNKWSGYQECTIDGYSQINDSIYLFIVTNRVLNGNEANKYLISLNSESLSSNTFLLAKVTKSIDESFEVYSKIDCDTIQQVQIYKLFEEDYLITDSIFYKYITDEFVNYSLIEKDSIRTFK